MTLRISIGALLKAKAEDKANSTTPVNPIVNLLKPAKPNVGQAICSAIDIAEQNGDKAALSGIFTEARKSNNPVLMRMATDAIGRVIRGENKKPEPPKPEPSHTANPVKALAPSPERKAAIEMLKAKQVETEKKGLIKEYCQIMRQDSWTAGMSFTLSDLRAKIRSARKAAHKHQGGGKKNGLCGGKQKKAKASNRK